MYSPIKFHANWIRNIPYYSNLIDLVLYLFLLSLTFSDPTTFFVAKLLLEMRLMWYEENEWSLKYGHSLHL